MLDHDSDSYYKISRAFVDGEPVGNLTRDHILDNITLYWLTGTGASAARWYWETGRAVAAARAAGEVPPAVSVPVGFTTFPGELFPAPRSWVETVYPGLAYFNEAGWASSPVITLFYPGEPSCDIWLEVGHLLEAGHAAWRVTAHHGHDCLTAWKETARGPLRKPTRASMLRR